MSSEQIVNAPSLYVDGLQVIWLSSTTLDVSSGACRDKTNSYDFSTPFLTLIDAATVGVNGLDKGALAASTPYAIYLIGDPQLFNPTGFLISADFVKPTLPFGYGAFRRIGSAVTDGASHFLPFYCTGTGQARTHLYASNIGVGGTLSATTFTSVNLDPYVPPLFSTDVYLTAVQQPAAAGNTFSFRNINLGGTVLSLVAPTNTAIAYQVTLQCVSSGTHAIVQYAVSAGNAALYVQGYVDYL